MHATLAELEDGFRHLVDGVRGLLEDLRLEKQAVEEENARLLARIDELRQMVRTPVVEVRPAAPEPVVVPTPEPPAPSTVEEALEILRLKQRQYRHDLRERNKIKKPCERCGKEMIADKRKMYCSTCLSIRIAERMTVLHDANRTRH